MYVYDQIPRFTLTIDHHNTRRNVSMNALDFHIWKGTTCRAEFKIVDRDRKSRNMNGDSLTWIMKDKFTGKVLGKYALEIQDPYKGLVRLSIPAEETYMYSLGVYNWAIINTGTDRAYEVDLAANIFGNVIVDEGPLNTLQPSIEICANDFLTNIEGFPRIVKFFSPPFHGAGALGNSVGLHTVAFYGHEYTGTIQCRVSLEGQAAPVDEGWTYIPIGSNGEMERRYNMFTGIDGFTFDGLYNWVQFVVIPDQIYINNPYKAVEGFALQGVQKLMFRC